MKKLFPAFALCLCLCLYTVLTSMIVEKNASSSATISSSASTSDGSAEINYWVDSMYSMMHLLEAGLSRSVFFSACKGYQYFLLENALARPGLLTICDLSQSSSKKRLYVLDLNYGKILFNTYVAHGRNSGNDYATSFSNSDESHKSSLGFMITAETYVGENGYSMRLDGKEKGFNNNVRARSIVMHGSDYVGRQRALSGNMMGRSWGCPAVPATEVKSIINCIKGGSCFFNYYPDKKYTKASPILNASFPWPVVQFLQIASTKTPSTQSVIAGSPDNLTN